jgi:hypothetical protein
VERAAPVTAGEEPEAEALARDGITKSEQEGFAYFLGTGERGATGAVVEGSREMGRGLGAGATCHGNHRSEPHGGAGCGIRVKTRI